MTRRITQMMSYFVNLVLDLSLKRSVKHVLTVIFLAEVDKVGRSSFYWDPFAALLDVLYL